MPINVQPNVGNHTTQITTQIPYMYNWDYFGNKGT